MDIFQLFLDSCRTDNIIHAKMYAEIFASQEKITVPEVMHLKKSKGFEYASIANHRIIKWYIEQPSFVDLYKHHKTEDFALLCAFGPFEAVKFFVEEPKLHKNIDKKNALASAIMQPKYEIAKYLLNTDLLDFENEDNLSGLKNILNKKNNESAFIFVLKKRIKSGFDSKMFSIIKESKCFANLKNKEKIFEDIIHSSSKISIEVMSFLLNNFEVYNSKKIKELDEIIKKKFSMEIQDLFNNFVLYDKLNNENNSTEKNIKRKKI